MTTETTQKFQGRQPDHGSVGRKSLGYKSGSGFTHAYNVEPVTFHPDYAFKNDVPGIIIDVIQTNKLNLSFKPIVL